MLYEDDFEFEEQPANIRDRQIPGKTSRDATVTRRRDRGPAPRRFEPRGERPAEPRAHHELPESAEPARDLLAEILTKMNVQQAEIHYIPRPEGEYLEVTGPDLAALIGRHGNTLEAINLIFNNVLNAGNRNNRRYYTIDAEGYRARRADQLKALTMSVVERCLREKQSQEMEPMLPSERKIVHIILADNESVRTESTGEEPERRVVIYPS